MGFNWAFKGLESNRFFRLAEQIPSQNKSLEWRPAPTTKTRRWSSRGVRYYSQASGRKTQCHS